MPSLVRSIPGWLAGAAALLLCSGAALAAPKIYVGNFKDNTVSVIDAATDAVLGSIPVSAGPHGIAISPDGRWVYVAGDGSSLVNVIDAQTDRVAHTIEVGKGPHGVTLTPDGALLLVAVNGEDRVAFVDTAGQSVVGSVSVPKPHTIAISPDGRLAYVASQEPGHFALAVVDIPGRKAARSIALDRPPRDAEFGNGGKTLYFTLAGVNAIQVLDPATDRIVAAIATGISPHVAIDPAGSAFGLAVVQGPGELLLFDPATNQPLRRIGVGKQPHWVAESADGRTAFVSNEGADSLSVIDLASGKSRTIAVGHGPRKVAVQRGGERRVSISNFQFDPATLTVARGQVVQWRNDDGAPHAVHFDDPAVEAPLLPGEAFSRAFEGSGTYDYMCSVHNYMRGRVVVLAD